MTPVPEVDDGHAVQVRLKDKSIYALRPTAIRAFGTLVIA